MDGPLGALEAFLDGPASRTAIYGAYAAQAPAAVEVDLVAGDPAPWQELAGRCASDGFGVFTLLSRPAVDAEVVLQISRRLRLGDPFVPPVYREPSRSATYAASGVNVISAVSGRAEAVHPAFQTSSGQALHCDGTLQAIGEIPTSVLVCVSPAIEGGETVFFKAVAAFTAIARNDPSTALALTADCLRRTATVSLERQSALGPAFALSEGGLLSRYSIGSADEWVADSADRRRVLGQAIEQIRALTVGDSGFVRAVRLERGQGVVFANDRIAHGRTPYKDAPDRKRHLLRALFRLPVSFTSEAHELETY